MELLSLAVKDLNRRKAKNLYVTMAVMIPVAILCTILLTLDNADKTLSNIASKFGFTLTIQPKNVKVKKIDQIGVVLDEYISETVVAKSQDVILQEKINSGKEGQIIAAPRLYIKTDIQIKSGSFSAIVAGVDYGAERGAKPSWSLTSGRWPENNNQIIMGGTLAEAKNINAGDELIINSKKIRVAGIMENYNASEDYMVLFPFRKLQTMFGKEGLVSVVNIQDVALDRHPELLENTVAAINSSIPNIKAITPQQFSAIKHVLLKKTFKFLLSIILATVLVSIFSIFNIITTVLYSRVREIGMLKSVGASRSQLLKIFLYEYSIIGLVGGAIGYPVGVVMSSLTDKFLLDIGSSIRLSFSSLVIAVLMGFVCSLIASIYPTMKLSAIKITESFRTQWEM
jgi:putative ABC transport system permease protein